MRAPNLSLLLAVVLLACAAPAAAQAVRSTGLSPAETDSILQLARATDDHWNAGDAPGLSRLFTADGHNRIVGTPVDLRGQAAIESYFVGNFAQRTGRLRHRTVVEELQLVAPGVALADGKVWVEEATAEGGYRTLRRFTMHAVAVRTPEGVWRLRANRVHLEGAPAS